MNQNMNYPRGLRLFRAITGVSQQQLAQRANLSKSLISRIEAGKRSFSEVNRQKIAKKLNIPVSLIELLSLDPHYTKVTNKEIKELGKAIFMLSKSINHGEKIPK